ncbi:MAG: PLP-dependent transferase [Bacteroidota bacterium]
MKFETKAIRIQTPTTAEQEHSTAIFPTSSFVFDNAEQMRAMFAGELDGNINSRFTNPNCQELERKMAALEMTDTAVSTASGMSAVFSSIMGLLEQGDHLLASRALFGTSHSVFTNWLPKWGIDCTFIEPNAPDTWEAALQPNTKMFFVETPSNPILAIVDLEKANDFAKAHGLIFNVDNCFATPYLQQPAQFGADLIIHSATKFIDGQGRVTAGIVAGKEEWMEPIKKFHRNAGPTMSPFNAWILSKSLETLAVRMDRHCSNALHLAEVLSQHEQLSRVNYPFLDSHPAYAIAKKQMRQGGALLTMEVKGGLEQGRRFLDHLQLLSLTANLGDSRTIATHPASTTHARLSEAERLEAGITNGMIRISVGLEHVDDLLADIDQALVKSEIK